LLSLGHQETDVAADRLFSCVTENLLGSVIEGLDFAEMIGDYDRIDRSIQRSAFSVRDVGLFAGRFATGGLIAGAARPFEGAAFVLSRDFSACWRDSCIGVGLDSIRDWMMIHTDQRCITRIACI
jgi:hypothetical protein